MTITAVNEKHQSNVNKCYKHYRKYHELVNFNDDQGTKANMAKQEKQFEGYATLYDELPKREQVNFDKQHYSLHGYT